MTTHIIVGFSIWLAVVVLGIVAAHTVGYLEITLGACRSQGSAAGGTSAERTGTPAGRP